jgi:voltage-gated sodium channel
MSESSEEEHKHLLEHDNFSPNSSILSSGNERNVRQDDRHVLHRLKSLRTPNLDAVISIQGEIEEQQNQRAQIAAELVADALEGWSPRFIRTSSVKLKIGNVIRSKVFQAILILMIVVHCLFVIWEPSGTFYSSLDDSKQIHSSGLRLIHAELFFVFVYLIDVSLQVYVSGWRRSLLDKKWNIAYLLVSFIICFEILGGIISREWTWVRFSRAFRGFLLVCKSQRIRRIASRILRAVPGAAKVLFCTLIIASYYSLVGMLLFKNSYHDDDNVHEKNQNFDSFLQGLIVMLVANTTENFPDAYFLALKDSPVGASIFFVSYIVIGTWLFLNLIMAVIYNMFEEEHISKVARERIKEQTNLFISFRVLANDEEVHSIGFQEFYRMYKCLNISKEEGKARVLFSLLDRDKSGEITVREFLLLAEFLNFCTLSKVNLNISQFYDPRWFRRVWFAIVNPNPRIRFLVSGKIFQFFEYFIIFGNTLVIFLLPGLSETADMLNNFFLGLMMLEFFMKWLAHGYKIFWEKHYFIITYVVISVCAELFAPDEVVYSIRCARILRIFFAFRGVRLIISTLAQTITIILELLSLMLIVTYIFAIIGMEIFSHESLDIPPHSYIESFDTFPKAMLSLFQISTTNNWQEVMYPAVDDTSIYHSLYFLLYFFIICIVILNILATLIIAAYSKITQQANNSELEGNNPFDPNIKVLRITLETGEVEYWRVAFSTHYSRSLIQDELPVFNEMELNELENRLKEALDQISNPAPKSPWRIPLL